ncbi:MAG: sigma-E processing peptidase SpoIIGA [Eubacteriaceae bacterium]|nr:sigma-E processing peptidase SpoIIGA [Eubacteriaceae bacterium]
MRYIYGEAFILQNFIGNYMVLSSVLRARRRKKAPLRVAAASLCGAVYALAALKLGGLLVGIAFKLASCAAMSFILTRKPTARDIAINACLALFSSFACAGSALFFSFCAAKGFSGALAYEPVPSLAGLICGSLFTQQVYSKAYLPLEGVLYAKAQLFYGPDVWKASLLNDSGNLLKTLGGNSVALLNEALFSEITGLAHYAFSTYEEYEKAYGSLEPYQQKRCSALLVESANASNVQIVFKIDRLEFEDGLALEPAYISGAKNVSVHSFDGVYNRNHVLERCIQMQKD